MKQYRPKMHVGETYDIYVNGKTIGDVGAFPDGKYLMGIGTKSDLIDQSRFDAWVAKYPNLGWVRAGKEYPVKMATATRIAAKYLRRKTAGFPTSMLEWEKYVRTLAGEALFSKTLTANTQAFADSLRKDGHTMADYQAILLMLVRQCILVEVRLPGGGAFDLVQMSRVDPIARQGVRMKPEEIQKLEITQHPKTETDDIDQMMIGMEMDDGTIPDDDDEDDDQ